VAASNNRVHTTRSLYYCLFAPHIFGVDLRAHSVRGEPRIQRHACGEAATLEKRYLAQPRVRRWWMDARERLTRGASNVPALVKHSLRKLLRACERDGRPQTTR